MENNDSKPNTRSQKRKKTNKKTKIKKKNQNLDICKVNNGNDDDEPEEEDIGVIIEDITIKDEENDEEDDEENDEDNDEDNDEENEDDNDEENEEDINSLKRKFESIFDNNTIIMFNNKKRSNDLNNIFSTPFGENELLEDEDEDFENMHNKIQKSKKYIEKNPNFSNYNEDEADYFLNSSIKNKNKINKFEKKTIELNKEKIPLRFKIINSKIDDNLKAIALKKLNHLSSMNERSGEYFKILNYVENLCKIPCGIYKKLNIPKKPKDVSNFLLNSYNILNKNVYGHEKSKEQIIRIIGQWISNPELKGNVIGIHGSPGCGKTRLIKEGLCKALNLPFVFIPLGGINDSSYLTGHSFTYEGAIHGKIVDSLMKAQCMNPIIYFDELDKVSDSSRGEEIINTLIHLTDSTQNDAFFDKYFYDIPLNLSKALIIFTYNDDMRINRILRDRMIRINTDSYKNKDKISISKEFLIPEILRDFNFSNEELIFTDEMINYIIGKSEGEDGVRNLRRSLECIISNINLIRLMDKNEDNKFNTPFSICKLDIQYETPFIVNKKVIDYLIKTRDDMNVSVAHLYT
tara:strand:+ start:12128 stop:13855 length:1728 start_codon:yes stop_codon:yes gene_type:complete